jgi:cytochrome c-type biogenesis protein CcmH
MIALRMGLLLVLCWQWPALALDIDEALEDPGQQAVYERLLKEVRCLVCQNQPIGDSNAPLAADLRREIRNRLEQGDSETEVKQFLLARYGDFVLYRPRFTAQTALLWLAPALLLLLGAVSLGRVIQRRASLPIPSEEEDLQRLRRESGE